MENLDTEEETVRDEHCPLPYPFSYLSIDNPTSRASRILRSTPHTTSALPHVGRLIQGTPFCTPAYKFPKS
jgi:hypothetical protein